LKNSNSESKINLNSTENNINFTSTKNPNLNTSIKIKNSNFKEKTFMVDNDFKDLKKYLISYGLREVQHCDFADFT